MSEHPPPSPEKESSSAMQDAFARAEKEKGGKFAPRPAESAVKNAIPKELEEIYGDEVPLKVLEMLNKLKGKEKRESYVAMLAAKKAERKGKKSQKNQKGRKESFDPHSVPSVLTVQEQKLNALIREEEAVNGIMLHPDPGITDADISGIRVDQYDAPAVAREDLETLNGPSAVEGASIVPDSEDAPDNVKETLSSTPDGTRDWREKWLGRLGALIKSAPERILGSERYERSKAYLTERSQRIDAEAKQMGRTYEYVKSFGEWYNKRHILTKAAVGLALAGGAIATTGVSAGAPLAFMTLIGVQRAVAAMGIFATAESKIKDSQYLSKRDKAAASMVGSIAYSLLAGYAIKEGVEWASDTRAGHAVQDLVRHWSSDDTTSAKTAPRADVRGAPPASTPPPTKPSLEALVPKDAAPAPDAKPEIPVKDTEILQNVAAPDAVDTPPAAEMPEEKASVAAIAGFQMEAMPAGTGDIAAEPEAVAIPSPDVGVNPPERIISEPEFKSPMPERSVIAAPSAEGSALPEAGGAPDEPLTEVKTEPEQKFAQVSVDPLGEVSVNGVLEESGAQAELPTNASPSAAPEIPPAIEPVESTHVAERGSAPSAQPVSTPAEPPPVRIDTTVLDYPARSGEPLIEHVKEVNADLYRELAPVGDASVVGDGEGNVVHDRFGNPVRSGFESLPAGANHFGVVVPETETHVYAGSGGKEIFVYGGSPAERAKSILEYLTTKDPNGVVYAASDDGKYRIPWRLAEGKLVPGTPARTSGILSFLSTWMKPPSPDDFAKIIK